MDYNSKNIRVAVKLFCAEIDQLFLNVYTKNLVKVTRTGDAMGRNRPPTLRKLFSKSAINIVLFKQVVLIMRIINVITNMDDIRQETSNKRPTLNLNKIK